MGKETFKLVILILIFGVATFMFLRPKKAEIIPSSLLSNFTPAMREFVVSKLENSNCIPLSHYFEGNDTICFKCEKFDACFGYAWVYRGVEGMKMNPKGKPYLKFSEFDVNVADFYYDGLADELKCKKVTEDTLECDYGVSFVFEDQRVKMKGSENNLEDIARIVCRKLVDTSDLSCFQELKSCKCNGLLIRIVGGEVGYVYTI